MFYGVMGLFFKVIAHLEGASVSYGHIFSERDAVVLLISGDSISDGLFIVLHIILHISCFS